MYVFRNQIYEYPIVERKDFYCQFGSSFLASVLTRSMETQKNSKMLYQEESGIFLIDQQRREAIREKRERKKRVGERERERERERKKQGGGKENTFVIMLFVFNLFQKKTEKVYNTLSLSYFPFKSFSNKKLPLSFFYLRVIHVSLRLFYSAS